MSFLIVPLLFISLSCIQRSEASTFSLVDRNGNDVEDAGLLLYKGGVVCAEGFKLKEAVAVCRELGHEVNGAKIRNLHGAWEIQNTLTVSMHNVECTDSKNWSDCKFKSRPNKKCADDHVHLTCDVHFKLVDSDGADSGASGLLLYMHSAPENRFGTVCDDYFNKDSADAVCRKMGYDRHQSWSFGDNWEIQSSYDILMTKLDCQEEKVSFMERCSFSLSPSNCEHREDIFLECITDNFSMVNHNGDRAESGGLLLFNGGTVCNDGFNENAAIAICKKMGYDGSYVGYSSMDDSTKWVIQDNYEIKLDDVHCGGGVWAECDFNANSQNCKHNEDIFLTCRGPETTNCYNKKEDPQGLKYRGRTSTTNSGLTCQKWASQTPNSHSVTPQRYPDSGLGDHNFCRNPDSVPGGPWCYNADGTAPRWQYCLIPDCADKNSESFALVDEEGNPTVGTGTLIKDGRAVCYEEGQFDDKAADAICGILGFAVAATWKAVVPGRDYNFAAFTKLKCLHSDWASCVYSEGSFCSNSQVINLECRHDKFSFLDVKGAPVTTKGLLLFNGGTVCASKFADASAAAICREMGYDGFTDWYVLDFVRWKVKNDLSVTLADVECSGESWESCSYLREVHPYCQEYHDDIYLNCGETSFSLVDSNYADVVPEGLLLYNGGTVCADKFTDTSADVICREMGFARSVEWRKFGNRNDVWDVQWELHITLSDVKCSDRDGDWSSCQYDKKYINCDHDEDVYLTCEAPSCGRGQYYKFGQGCKDCREGTYSRGGSVTSCLPCPEEGSCEDVIKTTESTPVVTTKTRSLHPDGPFSLVGRNGKPVQGSGLLLYNGGAVCADSFESNEAVAVCRELGYEVNTAQREQLNLGKWDVQDNLEVSLFNVDCPSSRNWNECDFVTEYTRKCWQHVLLTCDVYFELVDEDGMKAGPSGLLLFAGGTVCDDSFGTYSANAVCQKMGYDRHTSYDSANRWALQSSYPIAMDDLNCASTGDEFLEKCKFSSEANCGHQEDIFLQCTKDKFTLVNHQGLETKNGGLVLFSGGTVCDDRFNDNAATAICVKMGFDGSKIGWSVMENDRDGALWSIQDTYSTNLDEVRCSGNTWGDCTFTTVEDCTHAEDVFLNCAVGTFALVDDEGNSAPSSGNVLYNGGSVCIDRGYFDDNAAIAICKEMGYDMANSWDFAEQSDELTTLTKIKCSDDGIWSSCTYSEDSSCESSKILSHLSCKYNTLTLVDLNGVEAKDRGLLLFNGGTVCKNGFEDTSAKAACRKMGYTGEVATWHNFYYTKYWSVRFTHDIAITNLRCPDGEWSSCSYSQQTRSNCNHFSDVYLDCGSNPFTLVDSSYNEAIPEGLLLYSGGTVCDDRFDNNAADAICREMGYERSISWRAFGYTWYQMQNQLMMKLDDVRCSDGQWESCDYWKGSNCGHDEDVYLHCELPSCDPGTYFKPPHGCIACPENTFGQGGTVLSCTPCPDGTFVDAGRGFAQNDCVPACGLGSFIASDGTCLECLATTFNDRESAQRTCIQCPDNMWSPTGSDSAEDCSKVQFFNQMTSEPQENGGVSYISHWIITKDTHLSMTFKRPNLATLDCNLNVFIENVGLDMDLIIKKDVKGNADRHLEYSLDGKESTINVQNSDRYTFTIDLRDRIFMKLNDEIMTFKNRGRYKARRTQSIVITISSETCFIFSEDESLVQRGLQDLDVQGTDSPAVTESLEAAEGVIMVLCKDAKFRDCSTEILPLGDSWNEFQVQSFKISDIPRNRAIVLTSDNGRSYTVNKRVIADSDLSDGAPQLGLYFGVHGGSCIASIQYIEVEQQEPEEEENRGKERGTERPPPKEITESGDSLDEIELPTEYKDVDEIKEAIQENKIAFKSKTTAGKKTVKTYKPNFKGTKVPIKEFQQKGEQYASKRNETNLYGYLQYNGFIDVGIKKNGRNKDETSKEGNARVIESVTVTEDEMIEAIKAFQRFNGFPETGEITEKQTEVFTSTRCGNRDTSYTEQLETFTCVEGKGDDFGKWIQGSQDSSCELASRIEVGLCAQFPADYATPDEIQAFVWNDEYYFETDVEFDPTGKDVSEVGIVFNYLDFKETADIVRVQHFTRGERLRFRYGTFKQGSRVTRDYVTEPLTDEQVTLRQFKLRVSVRAGAASLAVDGKRLFSLETKANTTSSVLMFTLGGSNYVDHRVKVFSSRICRRNTVKTSNRAKRYALSNFKWYSGGEPISYSFVNYSSTLGEQLTRQEVIRAIDLYSSHGLVFKEQSPAVATIADIVFMFIGSARHADGMIFYGSGVEKAHAFVPVHGEIHFNDYERYSIADVGSGHTSLFYVAMHEIGHTLGIQHSALKDAVMNEGYAHAKAYSTNDLDEDDIDAIRAQYGELFGADNLLSSSGSGSLLYEQVKGVRGNYQARLPVPRSCLDSIDAAFYFYDRSGEGDKIYLISYGYIWAYEASSLAMISGYPKRTAEVFYGATGQIDAAFDTGKYVCLIVNQNVMIYEVYSGAFIYLQTETLESLFGISETKVKSAFNHHKGDCASRNDICSKTTLIVSPSKHYEVSWTRKGKRVSSTVAGDGVSVLGEKFTDKQFQASFEYTRTSSGASEVLQFETGRVCRSRVFYPGDSYSPRTSWSDVPDLFQIEGWCMAS